MKRHGDNAITEAGREEQRRLLHATLKMAGWNLAETARRLRLGEGSPPVLRLIHSLGLTTEYESARKMGLIKRGGNRLNNILDAIAKEREACAKECDVEFRCTQHAVARTRIERIAQRIRARGSE